jgi:hypothetical protein
MHGAPITVYYHSRLLMRRLTICFLLTYIHISRQQILKQRVIIMWNFVACGQYSENRTVKRKEITCNKHAWRWCVSSYSWKKTSHHASDFNKGTASLLPPIEEIKQSLRYSLLKKMAANMNLHTNFLVAWIYKQAFHLWIVVIFMFILTLCKDSSIYNYYVNLMYYVYEWLKDTQFAKTWGNELWKILTQSGIVFSDWDNRHKSLHTWHSGVLQTSYGSFNIQMWRSK